MAYSRQVYKGVVWTPEHTVKRIEGMDGVTILKKEKMMGGYNLEVETEHYGFHKHFKCLVKYYNNVDGIGWEFKIITWRPIDTQYEGGFFYPLRI